MSKYTTELRFICERLAGYHESVGYRHIGAVIELARPKVFAFDYPIFDEEYRETLETKILKHYYTREIGAETFGLFQLMLDARMNEIMPKYNRLYNSALFNSFPSYAKDITTDRDIRGTSSTIGTSNDDTEQNTTQTATTERTESVNGNTTGTTTTAGTDSTEREGSSQETGTDTGTNTQQATKTRETLYSDTPQGDVTGLDSKTYLTNATVENETDSQTNTLSGSTSKNASHDDSETVTHNTSVSDESETETESTGSEDTTSSASVTSSKRATSANNGNTTQSYVEHIKANMTVGEYVNAMSKLTESLLDIDCMIIEELNDLFMLLW